MKGATAMDKSEKSISGTRRGSSSRFLMVALTLAVLRSGCDMVRIASQGCFPERGVDHRWTGGFDRGPGTETQRIDPVEGLGLAILVGRAGELRPAVQRYQDGEVRAPEDLSAVRWASWRPLDLADPDRPQGHGDPGRDRRDEDP
jgi:hypothetical protein